MTLSLHLRVLLAASVILAAFLGITGLVLDKAFRDSAETAVRDRLQGYVYMLLAAAERDTKGVLRVTGSLREPRFNLPGSGLYAEIRQPHVPPDWRSPSALGIRIPPTRTGTIGAAAFTRLTTSDGVSLYILSFDVIWEEGDKRSQRYTFRVAESLDGFYAQVWRFRRSLWGWLGAAAFLLLAVQGIILRWGLAPLRRVADDLAAIETGRSQTLTRTYPKELRGLTDNLNAFIETARANLIRYRDALGNLAHSLKTPLAVLRGSVEKDAPGDELRRTAQEQVDRMSRIIEYQLRRAATSGLTPLATPVRVADKAKQATTALLKVYADKYVDCRTDINADAVFRGDEGDLLEILGNVLDNAFKWCRSRVVISARMIRSPDQERAILELCAEDDGPGIPDKVAQRVVERGQRADTTAPGQGLGLAIVQAIVRAYRGRLTIQQSQLGGAMVIIEI